MYFAQGFIILYRLYIRLFNIGHYTNSYKKLRVYHMMTETTLSDNEDDFLI